jgi:hypothetical protein
LSRETRLLLVTISISMAVLLLLSRLRFPESSPIVEVPPPPLERLVARATYEDLAAIIADVERKISPNLLVLQLQSEPDPRPRVLADVIGPARSHEVFQHVPALRISENSALAAVGSNMRLLGIGGERAGGSATVIATDHVRHISLLRVTAAPVQRLPQLTLTELKTPAYVVVVEATRAGLTFRPLFIGNDDRFRDPRWERPLLPVSGSAVTSPGTLVFSLEGQFLGSAVLEQGTLAIATAADVIATADRLSKEAAASPVDPGLAIQPLTPSLAAALSVQQGVVVAQVNPTGPAAAVVQPADVLTALDGQPITSADEFLLQIARKAPGATVMLGIVRGGKALSSPLTLVSSSTPGSDTGDEMQLQNRRGIGSVVATVSPGSAAAAAGLREGDVIVQAGERSAPSPAQVMSMTRDKSRPFLLLRVQRDGHERVLAYAVSPQPASTQPK